MEQIYYDRLALQSLLENMVEMGIVLLYIPCWDRLIVCSELRMLKWELIPLLDVQEDDNSFTSV